MFRSGGTVWRPVPEPENKKPSGSGKTENEGIHDPRQNSCRGLASSFSLTEKRSREGGTRRAYSHADVLTFGFQTALPPSRLRLAEPVALEDCNPSQWRNRARISRASQRWLRRDGKAIHDLSKNSALITHPPPRAQELSTENLQTGGDGSWTMEDAAFALATDFLGSINTGAPGQRRNNARHWRSQRRNRRPNR